MRRQGAGCSGGELMAVRAWSILISGALRLAGAYLSLGHVRLFSENMSNGRDGSHWPS